MAGGVQVNAWSKLAPSLAVLGMLAQGPALRALGQRLLDARGCRVKTAQRYGYACTMRCTGVGDLAAQTDGACP